MEYHQKKVHNVSLETSPLGIHVTPELQNTRATALISSPDTTRRPDVTQRVVQVGPLTPMTTPLEGFKAEFYHHFVASPGDHGHIELPVERQIEVLVLFEEECRNQRLDIIARTPKLQSAHIEDMASKRSTSTVAACTIVSPVDSRATSKAALEATSEARIDSAASEVFSLSEFCDERKPSDPKRQGFKNKAAPNRVLSYPVQKPDLATTSRVEVMYADVDVEVAGDDQSVFGSVESTVNLATWTDLANTVMERAVPGPQFSVPDGPQFNTPSGRNRAAELPKSCTRIPQFDEDGRPQTPFVPDMEAEPRPLLSPIGIDMKYMPKTFALMDPWLHAQHVRLYRIDQDGGSVQYITRPVHAVDQMSEIQEIEVFTANEVTEAFENPGEGKFAIVEKAFNQVAKNIKRDSDQIDAATEYKEDCQKYYNKSVNRLNDMLAYMDFRAKDDAHQQVSRLSVRHELIRHEVRRAYHAQLDLASSKCRKSEEMLPFVSTMQENMAALARFHELQTANFDAQGRLYAQAAAWQFYYGEDATASSGGISYAKNVDGTWVVTAVPHGPRDQHLQTLVVGQIVPGNEVVEGHFFDNLDMGQPPLAPTLTVNPITSSETTQSTPCLVPEPSTIVASLPESNQHNCISSSAQRETFKTPPTSTLAHNFTDYVIKPLTIHKVSKQILQDVVGVFGNAEMPESRVAELKNLEGVEVALSPFGSPRPEYNDQTGPAIFIDTSCEDLGQAQAVVGRDGSPTTAFNAQDLILSGRSPGQPLSEPQHCTAGTGVILAQPFPARSDVQKFLFHHNTEELSVVEDMPLQRGFIVESRGPSESTIAAFDSRLVQRMAFTTPPNRAIEVEIDDYDKFDSGSIYSSDDGVFMHNPPVTRRRAETKNGTHSDRSIQFSPTLHVMQARDQINYHSDEDEQLREIFFHAAIPQEIQIDNRLQDLVHTSLVQREASDRLNPQASLFTLYEITEPSTA